MATVNGVTRICVACNEDGFGPSALAYYVIRKLVDIWQRTSANRLRVTVLNRSAATFNRKIYEGLPVRVEPIDSLVCLQKPNGEVHVGQTLERLRQYASSRAAYANRVKPLLEVCSVAIDIGVPLFSRAAAQFQVPHRLTVFDHSWAATLRLIASAEWQGMYRDNPRPGPEERSVAERIALDIEADEACATEVFLFENYLTPGVFVEHWRRLGAAPRILRGVLGTRVSPKDALTKLDSTIVEYGNQRPTPRDRPLVLLSPGGTPVWDALLPKLLNAVLGAPTQDYVLVVAKDLAPLLNKQPDLQAKVKDSDRIRYYGPLRGATQQAVLPAFSRIVTRAGGGTVNDALAAGVEFVFVEEPQVQVRLIERECAALGLTGPAATLEEFCQDPKQCIDRLVAMPLPQAQIVPARGVEATIVQRILQPSSNSLSVRG